MAKIVRMVVGKAPSTFTVVEKNSTSRPSQPRMPTNGKASETFRAKRLPTPEAIKSVSKTATNDVEDAPISNENCCISTTSTIMKPTPMAKKYNHGAAPSVVLPKNRGKNSKGITDTTTTARMVKIISFDMGNPVNS